MVDPEQIFQRIEAALKNITAFDGRVFDGQVDDSIAVAGGYVLPYVLLSAGVGDNPAERPLTGVQRTDSLIYDFQTTAVGPNAAQTRTAARLVNDALLNLRVGTGRITHNQDGFDQQSPIPDNTVSPARFMLPRPWRLLTN